MAKEKAEAKVKKSLKRPVEKKRYMLDEDHQVVEYDDGSKETILI